MTKQSFAPWTEEQVERLQLRQQTYLLHPYTCLRHSYRALRPTVNGWVCDGPGCDYSQNWAQDVDVNKTNWWNNVGPIWDDLEDA